MSKHLADHRKSSTGARLAQFMRLARDRSESAWRGLWQRTPTRGEHNRRTVEYIRIERGRKT